MKKKIYVALLTPFTKDNQIDYLALKKILDDLLIKSVDGVIVNGTTAESCTLSEEEKFTLLDFVCKHCNGRCEIYFGCGTNNTVTTIQLLKKAEAYPIQGFLIVTPYYNKPSQQGLYMHYHTIASATRLPIILYEVQSRCGCFFTVETIQKLLNEHQNIMGLKYASKKIEKIKDYKQACPSLKLYCGDDGVIKECDEAGCDGVISVIAHLFLNEIRLFYEQDKEYDFFLKRYSYLLFKETNPIGIKYLMSKYYLMTPNVRLPLVELQKNEKEYIDAYFDKFY